MRIRYSIVIPGVFIIFCIFFAGLVYLTIQEQEQAKKQYEKDQKTLYFVKEEIKKINENLNLMLEKLDREDFEAAFTLHSKIMIRMENIEEIGTGLSSDTRKRLSDNFLKPGISKLNILKEHLAKGDIKSSRRIIKKLLEDNNK